MVRPQERKMLCDTQIQKTSETSYTNTFQNDLGISEGDLYYLRENGYVDKNTVDDDVLWRLDDDGNWPEVD